MDETAWRVADRLAVVDGVVGLTVGGSVARGTADDASDLDLGIYYRGPLDVDAIRRVAVELDDSRSPRAVTGLGEWGPWVNGGAWMRVGGRDVDLLYRDLDRVETVWAECREGRVRTDYQVGHPHGFHSHMYLAELHHGRVLHDPSGELSALRARFADYPEAMRRAIVRRGLEEAEFSIGISRKAAARGDVAYVVGNLYRAVACLVQALFAMNREYFVNEKGSVAAVEGFAVRPEGFARQVAEVLGSPGADAKALAASPDTLGALIEEIRTLDR